MESLTADFFFYCYFLVLRTNFFLEERLRTLLVMVSSIITQHIERKAAGPIINKEMIIVFLLCMFPLKINTYE